MTHEFFKIYNYIIIINIKYNIIFDNFIENFHDINIKVIN